MVSRRRLTELGRALRKEMKPFIKKHESDFYGNFGGACGVMSYAMYQVLKRLGLKPVLALAGPQTQTFQHCWVEVDGLIVDLTATQFGYDKTVQVTSRPSEWHKPLKYRGHRVINELKTWHDGQSPMNNRRAVNAAVNRVLESHG